MTSKNVLDAIRDQRNASHITQAELADKLGIRQSQISELERGVVDPSLSTVQDVSRTLDLELMLIPRKFISVVESLLRRKGLEVEDRPLYALNENDSESAEVS